MLTKDQKRRMQDHIDLHPVLLARVEGIPFMEGWGRFGKLLLGNDIPALKNVLQATCCELAHFAEDYYGHPVSNPPRDELVAWARELLREDRHIIIGLLARAWGVPRRQVVDILCEAIRECRWDDMIEMSRMAYGVCIMPASELPTK